MIICTDALMLKAAEYSIAKSLTPFLRTTRISSYMCLFSTSTHRIGFSFWLLSLESHHAKTEVKGPPAGRGEEAIPE